MRHFHQWLLDSLMRVSGWLGVVTMLGGAALSFSADAKQYSDAHSVPSWGIFALGVVIFLFASFRAWSEERVARERTEEKIFPVISVDHLEDSQPDSSDNPPILKIWFCLTNTGEHPAEKVSCHLVIPPGRSVLQTGRHCVRDVGTLSPKANHLFAMETDVMDRQRALLTWEAVVDSKVSLRINGFVKYTTSVTKTDKLQNVIFDFDMASRNFLSTSQDATPKKSKHYPFLDWIVGASG